MRTLLASALSVVCVPTIARAQRRTTTAAPATTAPSTRAAELFFRGYDALNREDFATAVESLEASYALRREPSVLLNLGIAYRGAGDYAAAIDALERYVASVRATASRERLDSVRATIRDLSRRVGTLVIDSRPAGASVRIDGRAIGVTPVPPQVLPVGEHRVDLEMTGFAIVREQVTISPRQRLPLRFLLADLAVAARLRVTVAQPHGTTPHLTIDGIDTSGAYPVMRQLTPGGHRIEVTSPGYEPFRAEIVLAPRQDRRLAVRMNHVAAPLLARPWIWIAAGVVLAGAAVGVGLALHQNAVANGPNAPPLPAF